MTDNPVSTSQENYNSQYLLFQKVFESQSGLCILLTPQFIVLSATTALLNETYISLEDIKGKYLFDIFPDNPSIHEFSSTAILKASLEQVLATGKLHQMEVVRYDIQDPSSPRHFLERYWNTINKPIFNDQGEIICILHETANATEEVWAIQQLEKSKERERAAMAQVEQSRFRLERLIDQAPAALAILEGPDLVYKVLNEGYRKLFPGRELLGLPLFEALPELKNQPIDDIITKVYNTGETFEGRELLIPVARYEDQPAEDIYWDFIYQALFDTKGRINGVLIFALDVTEAVVARQKIEKSTEELRTLNQELEARVKRRTKKLQAAEAEAERQSKRLRNLFMQAPSAICILSGPELVYELVNPVYQQLFPDRELLCKPILEALPEIKDNLVYKTFLDVYETGITHEESEMLIPFMRPEDGQMEDRYFKYIQQARYNEQGQVDGVVVFALEVTQQVQARKAVEASEQQLKLVTDSLPVLISYLDKDVIYRFTNKAYEKWFPYKANELMGRRVRDVVGEKAYANVEKYIAQALGGNLVHFEAEMPYREDFKKFIHTSYVPDIRDGEVKGFYTLVTDITEQVTARKALEESEQKAKAIADELAITNQELKAANLDLADANKQLVHTNIDLDNFIYTASHDLRSPISNIERLLIELLLELPEQNRQEGEAKQIISMMQKAVDRFKKTISNLTDISKLQKGEAIESQLVNLPELIEEVTSDLGYLINESKAEVIVDYATCKSVSFSEKNLRSIVYNLISNALKYRHSDRLPLIRITCQMDSGQFVLKIKDNGLGLSKQNKGKLFTMFRRFHDHVEGSGVGLYMVKRIVDNAGGKIEVETEEGVGTTFKVYLPMLHSELSF
ncbi:PAS domain-containing protein [Pontibacter pudoricolor]|uniref:PAS domain-containing protein n=1 Tax=Pontibacter pudoricolor TaxID=2694930 RepID=UPI00139154F4|nr:PAS domain-containing protein [Pontibacter pudoricolor]